MKSGRALSDYSQLLLKAEDLKKSHDPFHHWAANQYLNIYRFLTNTRSTV